MLTYKIVRMFLNGDSETIATGLTSWEAQEHCRDKETSSRTATSAEALILTQQRGPWFDGYDLE